MDVTGKAIATERLHWPIPNALVNTCWSQQNCHCALVYYESIIVLDELQQFAS
jgi:hypothetical protein